MKRSSDNGQATPDPKRARLACWIAEWDLLKALAPAQAELTAQPAIPAPTPSTSAPPVQAGDIRLLHPAVEPSGLRYVAVATAEDTNDWVVVPFGLLAEPATPDEVLTRRAAPPLRVLCPWNRFRMPAHLLQLCWLVDRLTDEESAWCRSPLPPGRTGAPLHHPLDPRWDYLEMESEFRQRVGRSPTQQVTYEIPYPSELRKAAEDSAPYGDRDDKTDKD